MFVVCQKKSLKPCLSRRGCKALDLFGCHSNPKYVNVQLHGIGKMKIRKGYKFKIKLTKKIEQYCILNAGHSRFVWNYFHTLNSSRLREKHRIMYFYEMDYWKNNLLKVSEEYGFLKEASSIVLQQKLRDLDKSYKDAFDKNQPNKRLPRKKKKGIDDSFRFIYPKQCTLQGKRIKLPKIGWVNFFKSRKITGTPKNVTISRDGDNWFLAIQCEEEIKVRKSTKRAIGIDLGVKKFAVGAYSDRGKYKFYEPFTENYGKKYQDKKAKLQRFLAKKKKLSNNWRRQNVKVNKVSRKIKNSRNDYLHKISSRICKNHAKIFVENLKIVNMSKSAKGTVENPGKNISQKSGLNRSILDQGWGRFREFLKYKSEWNGGELIKIDPKYTSQRCHKCEHTEKENRKTQDKFQCKKCGLEMNADRNAAINILTVGQTGIACQVSA